MPDRRPATDDRSAPPARAIAGPSLVLIGAAHTALGAVAYREPLAAMLRGGVGSAGEGAWPPAETAARQRAFWFEVSGVALVLLGDAVGAQERRGQRPPRRLGWALGALAVLGGAAMPVSGFWALLAPAAALVRASRGTAPTSSSAPQVFDPGPARSHEQSVRGVHRSATPRRVEGSMVTVSDEDAARELRLPWGERIRIIASGSETAGAAFEAQAELPPGTEGLPRHRHRLQTETFSVLEGRVRATVGPRTVVLSPGEHVTVPPGVPHTFANPFAEPARMGLRETPAGPLEEQLRALAGSGRFPPLAELAAINVRHDLSFALHGVPDVLQRPLWRLLAQAHARSRRA